MNEANGWALEFVHWFSTSYLLASIVASYLVRTIPPPNEVSWRPYVIFFNTLQRLSLGARRSWNNKERNGPPEKHIG